MKAALLNPDTPNVRRLRRTDLHDVMLLKDTAHWNQTEDDWLRLLSLAPDGCFAIDCDGHVVATATALCYGRDLAWIGMVLTAPDYRGRGFGRRLMQHVLEFLDCKAVRSIGLDATDMGERLYSALGFRPVCMIERWACPSANIGNCDSTLPAIEEVWSGPFSFDREFDREAFGADRMELLTSLSGCMSACIGRRSFAMGRPGSGAAYFGPCVCQDADDARALAAWFLAKHIGDPVYWDLLPENEVAVRIAGELGFAPVRRLKRMMIGDVPGSGDGLVYAIAGLELG